MHAFFDFIMLAIAAILAVMGSRRGLIREVFRFAAMLGGLFISFLFYRDLQSAISSAMANQQAIAVFSFLVIFVACFIAITGIGLLLRKVTETIMLGWLDNTLGGVLGIMKALLIAWAACLSISSMPIQKVQTEFGKSYVYKTFRALPKGLSLTGLEAARDALRGRKSDKLKIETDDDDTMKKYFENDNESDQNIGPKKRPGKKNKNKTETTDV